MPDAEKWGGSKVRKLMNRPIGAPTAAGGRLVDPLDERYGVASQPAYIKHYEANRDGKVVLNPYLQVATREFPAILDVKMAPYNWVIDLEGRVTIIPEAAHPLGRTYEKGFFRPEDKSKRKPGTRENFGHVSSLGGGPGRISGEILYDKESKTWTVNNKSGRYSKHNSDRTPQQLVNAANLIRSVVDPGGVAWGPVMYLLEYAPETVREELEKSPNLAYDDPAKKSRPHVVVMQGGVSSPEGRSADRCHGGARDDDPGLRDREGGDRGRSRGRCSGEGEEAEGRAQRRPVLSVGPRADRTRS